MKEQGPIQINFHKKTWDQLKVLSLNQLNGKKLYVMDGFCGANPETRICVRLVCEVAWQAHFFKNMFIRPTDEELANFKPDWTILNSCKTQCDDFEKFGMNSSTYIAFNIGERLSIIGGSWYGGEMKKGIFSLMNYWLPLKGIGAFHCSLLQYLNINVSTYSILDLKCESTSSQHYYSQYHKYYPLKFFWSFFSFL